MRLGLCCTALSLCAAGAVNAQAPIGIDAVEVFAERAKERRTPVAYTDVDKLQIERNLGSRSIPLLLNAAPSVYATPQSGSAGDARITVRGFSPANLGVLINGVPVNYPRTAVYSGWIGTVWEMRRRPFSCSAA